MEDPDRELVRRCQNELPYATSAFETLLRRYEPLVFRTCRRYLGNDQDGEEACQDVFLRVFHALPQFEGAAAFRTWLFRITANVCASRYAVLRRHAERQEDYRRQTAEEMRREMRPSTAVPDDWAESLSAALESLSPQDHQVLVLRYFTGLSFDELAETLGVGLSTAKMRVYRAQLRLKDAMERP